MRTTISQDPFLQSNAGKEWRLRGFWPCCWVACPDAGQPPFVSAYRRRFSLEKQSSVRIHVSADERYELFLDGERIGRGSERGVPDVWYFETYDLILQPGEHILVSRVWSFGNLAADAQMSAYPGFLLAAEGTWMNILGTGLSAWEARPLGGYTFSRPEIAKWKGPNTYLDGKLFPWGFERGEGEGWLPVSILMPAVARRIDWELFNDHVLTPATLPPMLEQPFRAGVVRFVSAPPSLDTQAEKVEGRNALPEGTIWQNLLEGKSPVNVPSHSTRRVIIDLENYYTAYPEITVSGGSGSRLRLLWAESLFNSPTLWSNEKGNRNEIEGKYFRGCGNTYLPDGGERRKFASLWWCAGRYMEICVQTGDQPLTIDLFKLCETRYPLEMESQFTCSDPKLIKVIPLLIRGMQMCSNETYFDCPYYEELMYAGDTRLEMLVTYIMTRDDRLPHKALRLFDSSRLASGLTQSRYPSRPMQIIAPFALWWVGMVYEFALWRNDLAFVEALMPGVRATMEGFRRFIGPEGLVQAPEGWNTIDWVPAWNERAGIPPDGIDGVSGLLNWQLIYTLHLVADLEARLGEKELSKRNYRQAKELAARATALFWDESRGLMADERTHQFFSEHTQCLALLSGRLDPAIANRVAAGLLLSPDLERTTIYFSHYLFETYRRLHRVDVLLARLALWSNLVEQGFTTPVEAPEPSRSDCHAWGSHPLFHYFATILGIRPEGLGFHRVTITPQLGGLTFAKGVLVHPGGSEIVVDFHTDGSYLQGSVSLPKGLNGSLHCNNKTYLLPAGRKFNLPSA